MRLKKTVKKVTALFLIVTFSWTNLIGANSWAAVEPIQMVNGQATAVTDPFATNTSTTQMGTVPVDFLAQQPVVTTAAAVSLVSIAPTAALKSTNVSSLLGNPKPYILSSSTSATNLSYVNNAFNFGYSVPNTNDKSGFSVSFDNTSTALIETQSLTKMTLGLKGTASTIQLEIVDSSGMHDKILLTGISNTVEQFWKIPTAYFSASVNKAKITQINFIVDQSNTTTTARSGTLNVRLNGLDVASPTAPLVQSAPPAFSNVNNITLSGAKEANTSLLINGVEVMPRNNSTAWSYQVSLPIEGKYIFSLIVKNSLGKISAASTVAITRDTVLPTGTIIIDSGALYSTDLNVALKLSAVDAGSAVKKMSFSADGVNWSAQETYVTAKTLTLSSGDGNKTVYVKFYDGAGNASAVYSKSIIVDTLPPSGTIKVNDGVAMINQRVAMLNLLAVDVGSGVSKMSFSTNGTSWTTAEVYGTTKDWIFSAGDGNKIVYVKFLDKSGKWSTPISAAVLMDTIKPTGSININSGAAYVNLPEIALNLSAADLGGAGIGSMSFSSDNVNWTVPEAYTTTKSFVLSPGDGNKTIYVKYFDKAGNVSVAYSKSILLDTIAPTGTMRINGGESFVSQTAVTLNLTAADSGTGLDKVSFSNDGVNWSVAETFAAEKNWVLAIGEDLKTVFVKFLDKAGNWSSVISNSIFLDVTAPTGAININSGTAYTNSKNITLNLLANDSGSGIDKMSFSVDGINWSALENFTASKAWMLSDNDGNKTIYVKYFDKAGNGSVAYSKSIILDTIAPIIDLLNAPTHANSASYMTQYRVDGVLKDKAFTLSSGMNAISIREIDFAGNETIRTWNVEYSTTEDINLAGGGLQHFENGKIQYQVNADGSRVNYNSDGSIANFSWGIANGNTKVTFLNDAQNSLEIRDASNQLIKIISNVKPPEPNLSNALKINLQDGIETYYSEGVLKEIRTAENVKLFNLTMSAPVSASEVPEIRDAVIAYPNGSIDIMWNKFLIRRITVDGSITDMLPDGTIGREISEEIEQTYLGIYDASGNVAGTKILSNQGDEVTYDEKGILKEVKGHDGKHFVYDRTQSGNQYLLSLNGALSSSASDQTLKSGKYAQDGSVLELDFQNGSKVTFENGQIKQAVNAQGETVNYSQLLSNGLAQGLMVNRGLANFTYDITGFLSQIQTEQGIITREQVDSNHDGLLNDQDTVDLLLELTGGNKLTDFQLDVNGKILNGIIETREGIKQKIENGILRELITADGKKYLIHNGQAELDTWAFQDGIVVKYGGTSIQQILFPNGKRFEQVQLNAQKEIASYVEIDGNTQSFFENGILKKRVFDGVQIFYSIDGRAQKIIRANGAEEFVEHQFDVNGNWVGLNLVSADGMLVYDEDGKLTAILTSGLTAQVEDSTIKSLSTRFGNIQDPVFNAKGNLNGEVVLSDERKLLIQDGKLLRITFKNGTQIDCANGRISRVENSEGIYQLTYLENSSALEDVKVNYVLSPGTSATGLTVEMSLASYLLANPYSEFSKIISPRPAKDIFAGGIQTQLGAHGLLDLSKIVEDQDRGDTYSVGGIFDPNLSDIYNLDGNYNGGYLSKSLMGMIASDLLDLDGDGDLDRIFVDSSKNFWWVQKFENGSFLSAEKWIGIEAIGNTVNNFALRFSNDSNTAVMGNLLDMNGDGRPDRVVASVNENPVWYVQLNNGVGFDPAKIWSNVQPLIQINAGDPINKYALQVRENSSQNQFFISDLIDMDGDNLPDRIIQSQASPVPGADPFNHWFFQKNNGHGFDEAVIWKGINNSFDLDPKIGSGMNVFFNSTTWFDEDLRLAFTSAHASFNNAWTSKNINAYRATFLLTKSMVKGPPGILNWLNSLEPQLFGTTCVKNICTQYIKENVYQAANALFSNIDSVQRNILTTSVLKDMNGDGRPDRILLKQKNPSNANSGYSWYIQWNNGSGFDPAVLFDDQVRSVSGSIAQQGASTAIQSFFAWDQKEKTRSYLSYLADVTGDGLPDRITLDSWSMVPANRWWVEVNDGKTFKDAVAWDGVEGSALAQIAPSQGIEGAATQSSNVSVISKLIDINGDKIPDHIFFKEGTNQWVVQYGTGHGFLPSQPMEIQGIRNKEAFNAAKYEYAHISLRAQYPDLVQNGKLVIRLIDENNKEVQKWEITGANNSWKDQYLAIDRAKTGGRYLDARWELNAGVVAADPQILVDDVSLISLHPNASTEWLDYLLTEGNVINAVQAAANDPAIHDLAQVVNAQDTFDWKKLLAVETKINFNATGAVSGAEKLNGETSQVQTSGNTTTITVAHTDGTVTQTTVPTAGSSNSYTKSINYDNGTPDNLTDDYTEIAMIAYDRMRSVTRDHSHKQPLQYSYEFDELNREITVIYDPDSNETEKSRAVSGLNGDENKIVAQIAANGVETRYTYNASAELTRTEITYKGRVRETFEQSITADGLHALKTESGSIEFYNEQGQIVGHRTTDGYYYKHEFAPAKTIETSITTKTVVLCDSAKQDCSAIPVAQRTLTVQIPTVTLTDCLINCETIHQVTLDHLTDLDGNIAFYTGSQLSSLELSTGLKMTFDGMITENSKDVNGNDIEITKPKNVVIFHQDGTITEFKNGLPYSVTSAAGHVISIEPDTETTTTGRVVLKNPSSSAEFHYAEAVKLWNQKVLANFDKYQLPDSQVVQVEYAKTGNKIVTQLFASGGREMYDAAGHIDFVVSEEGDRIIDYDYDAAGNPTAIHLEGSRRKLDQTILDLKIEIALKQYQSLLDVAEREQILNETVESQYIVQRNQLIALRAQIESQRNQLASIKVKGKAGKNSISDAMQQINVGLGQVNQALYQLLENRTQALANLQGQVKNLNTQINDQTTQAYTDISNKEREVQNSILTQEISPIVYHWYRTILGRDPSESEYEAAKSLANYSSGTFNLTSLKAQLQNSPEYVQRTAEVAAIKAAVKTQLLNYLAADDAGKQAFVAGLGINSQNRVSLARAEVDAIFVWMDKQNLHFGQSAFISLEALLDDAGIAHNRINMARDLILTDIITGTLTPIEKGDLLISMYAMNAYAARFGLNLSPLKLTYDALKSIFDTWCVEHGSCAGFRLVAHMDGNHYVVVTGITTRVEDGKTIEEVHYTDPGAGKNGDEAVVVSKDDFLKYWINQSAKLDSPDASNLQNSAMGYILSPRAPPAAKKSEFRVLNFTEQMQVRGSFFFLIPIIVAAIVVAIHAIVGAIIAAITAIIGALVASVSTIITGFTTFFGGLFGNFLTTFSGFFTGIFHGLTSLGGLVFNAITYGPNAVLGVLGLKAGTFLGSVVFSSLIGAEFLGAGKLLELTGLSPKFAQTIINFGKIITGVSLIATGAGSVLGFGFISAGTTDLLHAYTNLSPQFINALSIGAQALSAFGIGGVIGGTIQGAMNALKEATPFLTKELSSLGLLSFGTSKSLRLAALLETPINLFTGALLGGGFSAANILNSVKTALFSQQALASFISIGAQVGLNALPINPLLAGLGGVVISGLIDGLVPVKKVPGLEIGAPIFETTYQLKGVLEGLKNAVQRAFNTVLETLRTESVRFDVSVAKNGLKATLSDIVASALDRSSIEGLIGTVGNLSDYIEDKYNNHSTIVNYHGSPAKEVTLDVNGKTVIMTFDQATHELLRVDGSNGHILEGDLRLGANGNIYAFNGSELTSGANGVVQQFTYEDGNLVFSRYVGDGKGADWYPEQGKKLTLYSDGQLRDGIIEDLSSGAKTVVRNGKIIEVINPLKLEIAPNSIGGEQVPLFEQAGLLGEDGKFTNYEYRINSAALKGMRSDDLSSAALTGLKESMNDLSSWQGTPAGFAKTGIQKVQAWEENFYAVNGSPLTNRGSLGVFLAAGAIKGVFDIGNFGTDTYLAVESLKEAIRTGEFETGAKNYFDNWKNSLLTNPLISVANVFGVNTPNLNQAVSSMGNETMRVMNAFGTAEMVKVLWPYKGIFATGLVSALKDDFGQLIRSEGGYIRIVRETFGERVSRLLGNPTSGNLNEIEGLLRNKVNMQEVLFKEYKSATDVTEAAQRGFLNLDVNTARSFKGGQYQVRVLSEDLVVYRAEGGLAKKYGAFFGTEKPINAYDADRLYNVVVHGNDVQEVSTYIIKKGTVVYEGGVEGGVGVQMFLRNPKEKDVALLATEILERSTT